MIRTFTRKLAIIVAAGLGLALLTAAGQPGHRPAPPASGGGNGTITRTAQDSYILGNPAAPVKLVAYISYTCPHCAHFEAESDVQLRVGMIAPGKGSLEVRPFLRNPIDLVATLLAECGPPSRFFGNHALLLRSQEDWLSGVASLTDAQKARWNSPDFATRTRAIAGDLGLYALMEKRGYDRATLDRCLADKALADRLAQHTKDATDRDFVQGTPAFLLDGVPLAGTATWDALKPQLEARLH